MFRVFLLALLLGLSGCVSRAKQTEALRESNLNLPAAAQVRHVPFIAQEMGQCGPATLTMAMRWAGHPVTVAEMTSQVYNPQRQGSLPNDMIGATRRQGLMAVPVQGLEGVLNEVAVGHPVIVFENLALSWLPQWHYAVVIGYDLDRQEVILHSGPEESKRWDMEKFERSWMLADYWAMVVLPPDQLAVSADELTHVAAAAGLEQIGHQAEADQAYRQILKRWPNSLGALIGRGNVAFAQEDFPGATSFLRQAVRAHPDSSAARHNLAVAEGSAKTMKKTLSR